VLPKKFVALLKRANHWLDYNPLAAYIFVGLTLTAALLILQNEVRINREQNDRIELAQKALQSERNARILVQAEINRFYCAENNNQDAILGDLLVGTQQLMPDRRGPLATLFSEALDRLTPPTNCEALVRAYKQAATQDDLERLRESLRRDYRRP
jgi:hypothetical protein